MADYNINAVTRRVVYDGSSGLGPYAFNFEILDQNDINVYFNTTLLTITTDYTVTINANGKGSVTIVTGSSVPSTPVAADQITIIGSRDIERTTDFVTAGDLRAAALNEQLDALTIFDQQISERVDRSVQFPSYEPAGLNYTVPDVDDRKGKYLAFDNNGELTSTAGTTSDIIVSSFGGTLIDDVNASAARTTLGLGSVATLSSIPTANIDDNAITNAKMADDSVGSAEIIDNSVTAAELNISGNGTNGQYVVSDGDGSFSYETPATPTMQVFTSSGTWTKPTDCKKVKVTVVGGGGGGGAARGNPGVGLSTGGGGGGASIKFIDVTSISSETVTVGAGGAGGALTAQNGSTGGTSSFGSHCSATGGVGGKGADKTIANANSVFGGEGSGGDINIKGTPPKATYTSNGGTIVGIGGDSIFGGGATPRIYSVPAGSIQVETSGATLGGGAGGHAQDDGSQAGRPGGDGIVIVEEYY